MIPSPEAESLLADLPHRGFSEAEIYVKRGRSRRFTRHSSGMSQAVAAEEGWALRAGDHRRSLFHAATGRVPAEVPLTDPSPHALQLPEPRAVEPWSAPPEFDAPLVTEAEAATLLGEIERELRRERPECRLVLATLDDGAAEATLLSTRGVRAASRARAASLRLEAADRGSRCRFEGADRNARLFEPRAIAGRLVDRLSALEESADRRVLAGLGSEMLLAAPLAARLVQALAPLFLGAAATERLSRLGPLAPALTLVDDGRLASGVLTSPVDGEGLPCGRRLLVEEGRFVQPILAWWEAGQAAVPGCARRASWRDLPRRAPTHLFVEPSTTAVAELVAAVGTGAYLLDAEGAVRLDPGSLAFQVRVSGMQLAAGRAVAPLGRVRLSGDVRSLLSGIRALARDLQFVPGDGMFGAPSTLVSGREIHPL